MAENEDPLLKLLFFPELDSDLDDRTEGFAALTKTIERNQLEAALEKAGATVSVDAGWGAELGGARLDKRAPEIRHADGDEVEKIGDQVWKYSYEGGNLARIELTDPGLPGGKMFFDQEGNEIAV